MMTNETQLYGSVAVAKELSISLRQLYYWVHVLHVVQPKIHQHGRRKFRRFTGMDVKKLGEVRRLVRRGYTLKSAVEKINRRSEFRS